MTLDEKYQNLKDFLVPLQSAAVAFSGGVDSSFLLAVASNVLGATNVLAVTVSSCFVTNKEQQTAQAFCLAHSLNQVVCNFDVLKIRGIQNNPPNRCYLCKKALFTKIAAIAHANNLKAVLEGSNFDDESDYRPGLQAVRELGVKSPLLQAKLTKADIRELSHRLGLITWKRPAMACLASRLAYNEPITPERLQMVEKAEEKLISLGFTQVRVRLHGLSPGIIARIELLPRELNKLTEAPLRQEITNYLKDLGFAYVTLDLQGYRTGSMNEPLPA
ncbi:MAG: ATP-dependent sacrificial sulfur transferase LarE [bacterium]|nr:ATP-dependent sacrificial sulfur transferase LarE [bacterium]